MRATPNISWTWPPPRSSRSKASSPVYKRPWSSLRPRRGLLATKSRAPSSGILRTLPPMAQQDKISILGPRDDGTYVVEFRTAAGERLAISVPETKATVLKHFQATTAEPHIPTPGGGVMTGTGNSELRNVLQIGWTVVRGILELAILVYVLMSMLDPADSVIVAVLGIIYATIRSTALFQHFTITQ